MSWGEKLCGSRQSWLFVMPIACSRVSVPSACSLRNTFTAAKCAKITLCPATYGQMSLSM